MARPFCLMLLFFSTECAILSAEPFQYRLALPGFEFSFPRDHGAHPDYRTEWWYFTGNVSSGPRRYGFQLTFFRLSTRSGVQLYMAHFAVSDLERGAFFAYERFGREDLRTATARASPFVVGVGGWRAAVSGNGAGSDALSPVELVASAPGAAIDLILRPSKPVVLQGDRGFSRKGETAGAASYYYSIPRWQVQGTVRGGAGPVTVEGTAWLDREWSSSALESDQDGWDWFGLQLDDGTELMLYRIRRSDGTIDRHSAGSFVRRDGTTRRLERKDFRAAVLETWATPGGARYPLHWRLTVPGLELVLDVKAAFPGQLWQRSIEYWEGVVSVTGARKSRGVTGRGYVESTGRAGRGR